MPQLRLVTYFNLKTFFEQLACLILSVVLINNIYLQMCTATLPKTADFCVLDNILLAFNVSSDVTFLTLMLFVLLVH